MPETLTPFQPHPSHRELMVIDDVTFIPRHIVCAAIRFANVIVTGVRHYDELMRNQIDVLKGAGHLPRHYHAIEQQGFIDQYGQFVNRVDAAYIVVMNKQQLREPVKIGNQLYSENLY